MALGLPDESGVPVVVSGCARPESLSLKACRNPVKFCRANGSFAICHLSSAISNWRPALRPKPTGPAPEQLAWRWLVPGLRAAWSSSHESRITHHSSLWAPFIIHHSSFCLPPSVALGAFLLSAFYFLLWLGGGFGVALVSHWGGFGVALG